nr:DUF3393 domain-containing protein [Bacteroidota bacterium]
MKAKKNTIIVVVILVGFFTGFHVSSQTFEEYKKQQDAEFNKFKEENTRAYEAYVRKEKEGMEKLRKELEQYWGEHGAKFSTKKEWVEYSDDKTTRTDVDFGKGSANVDVLLTPEEAANPEIVQQKLNDAIVDLVNSKGTVTDIGAGDEVAHKLQDKSVLDGQILNAAGQNVNGYNAVEFAGEVVGSGEIVTEEVDGSDGTLRVKASVSLMLAPDHVKLRAEKYEDEVHGYAVRFGLPHELVYAIIETESSYNPKARSYIPAYGLMQIVPKFAGRDAFNYLYKMDTVVTATYLYNPDNNIELGTGYFKLLNKKYFHEVVDEECRILCCVAAYNTGARNVYKAFKDCNGKSKVIAKINTMSYDELLENFKVNLPFKETRNYVVKVDTRMKNYKNWLTER